MRFTALVLAFAVPAILPAQSPRITPAGDPSVKADTIYKLAVDPKFYPEYSVAILFDDGVIKVEADGRHTKTYRTIVQLLKPEAEENYQEQTFSYAPKHEKMTVNWIRVVKPNGEVISDKPSQIQDSDVPANEGDPVYVDRKVRRASLTGVKAGVIIDYSYTTEELKPFLAGDFFFNWTVNPGTPVVRSRYIVDIPATLQARIRERNLDFQRKTETVGGRRIYTWAKNDVPVVRSEALAADSNEVTMQINIGSPTTWAEIGKWYFTNSQSRYQLTPEVEKKISEVVAGAKTQDDTIRAVHRWVAQDIRYVSIAIGMGGYQPRSPQDVLKTGFGDCKDKATIFIAALAKFGIPAYPVLLNSRGGIMRDLPSIDQMDHVIAAVPRGGRYQYVDLTAELLPWGELPIGYQGEFGLVVRKDGTTEEITFPKFPMERNISSTTVVGTLSETGEFDGVFTETIAGAYQATFRNDFRHPIDSATRVNTANAIARNYFDGADGDSLTAFDGMDFSATPKLRVLVKRGRAAEPAGNSMILRLPLQNMRTLADAAKGLESQPKRRFHIDTERFWGYGVSDVEFRITLPPGWTAKLPKSLDAPSPFGTYVSEYRQNGSELLVRRRRMGASGVLPPEKLTDFIAWLRLVATDDTRMIVLEKSTAARP
jgi:transglutaminase-like putative cysteine protease